MVKNPPANAGDVREAGLIPGWGRSPGEGHGNPLQYPCLENPMDRAASSLWWAQYLWCMDLVTPWHVGSSWTRDRTHVPCTGRRILNHWTNREVQHFHFCHCENWVESTEAHLWDVVAYGPSLCLACITCQLCALGHCGNLWGLKGSQWSTPSGIVVGIKVKVSAQCLGSA